MDLRIKGLTINRENRISDNSIKTPSTTVSSIGKPTNTQQTLHAEQQPSLTREEEYKSLRSAIAELRGYSHTEENREIEAQGNNNLETYDARKEQQLELMGYILKKEMQFRERFLGTLQSVGNYIHRVVSGMISVNDYFEGTERKK